MTADRFATRLAQRQPLLPGGIEKRNETVRTKCAKMMKIRLDNPSREKRYTDRIQSRLYYRRSTEYWYHIAALPGMMAFIQVNK